MRSMHGEYAFRAVVLSTRSGDAGPSSQGKECNVTEILDNPVGHLQKLAAILEQRSFSVRVREGQQGRPATLCVINMAAPILTESVLVAPNEAGEFWFWLPWPTPISPVSDADAAANRIERILAEIGR